MYFKAKALLKSRLWKSFHTFRSEPLKVNSEAVHSTHRETSLTINNATGPPNSIQKEISDDQIKIKRTPTILQTSQKLAIDG